MNFRAPCCIITDSNAGVMELVDVVDSKSTASDGVPVRVRPPAPARRELRKFATTFYALHKKSSLTCSAAPRFKPVTASLGHRFVPPTWELIHSVHMTHSEMTFVCQMTAQARSSRQQRSFFVQTRNRFAGLRVCIPNLAVDP